MKRLLPSNTKRSIKESLGVPSLHWSLQNLRKKGFTPAAVIDIGAYEGFWTLDLLEVFPGTQVLMVEAQDKKEAMLGKVAAKHRNVSYAIELLSAEDERQVNFYEDETGSHVTNRQMGEGLRTLRTRTLDALLTAKGFPLPDLLKLDVQGHEKEVLKGAEKALAHAAVCLLEISLLDIGGGTPLLAEMIAFMDEKGFQAYDISHFIRRPYDKALFQIDMFFAKKDSRLVNEKRW